jgi:hypothetical protein
MRELVALALVVLALYVIIRFAAALVAGAFGSRYRAYRAIAAKYRGRCESRGLVDPPTVSFAHQGATVRVGLAPVVAGQPAPPRTRVVVRFARGLPFRLELMPMARPSPPQPPRGTRAVALGRHDFDRVYLVQANDPEIARTLLGPEPVRQAVETLRRLCPPAGMLVSVNPERLLVQVDRNLGASAAWLDLTVRAALLLHDWLTLSIAERLADGVSVVAVGVVAASEAGPPVCEVCGEAILGPHVVCTQCHTPCHRDCWGFVGACSTFGCTSKTHAAVTA